MDRLYIVIPAYNEETNISKCVDDWYSIVEKHNSDGNSRLVIINDGSRDHTYEKLTELAETRPLLTVLSKQNGGHGSAVMFGYRYAIEQSSDWIFQTDSDGQTNPDEFGAFWDSRMDNDAIIGNRVNRGDGLSRKFVEKIICLLLRIIFCVKVKDANAPFRLMKTQLVAKYIDKIPLDCDIPNIVFTTLFAYCKEKVIFLPISFKPRQGGINSINMRKIFRIGRKAIHDFTKIRRNIDG